MTRTISGLGFLMDDEDDDTSSDSASSSDSDSSGFDWDSFATTGLNFAGKILGTRYSVPQLNAGQVIKSGNTLMYQQPSGVSVTGTGLTTGISSSMLWLGAGLLAVVLLMDGKR